MYRIEDSTGIQFDGRTFNTFEEGCEWLVQHLETEDALEEFSVVEVVQMKHPNVTSDLTSSLEYPTETLRTRYYALVDIIDAAVHADWHSCGDADIQERIEADGRAERKAIRTELERRGAI